MTSSHERPIQLDRVDPNSPAAETLIDELSAILKAAYGSSGKDGFDPSAEGEAIFLVAHRGDTPAGCGGLRVLPHHPGVGEIKRMYSRPDTTGVGRAILKALEDEAHRLGLTEIWLETRRANEGAVRFYRKAGYRESEPYGKYVGRPEAICMKKRLT